MSRGRRARRHPRGGRATSRSGADPAAAARDRSPRRASSPRPWNGRAAWVPTLDRMDVATRERDFVRVAGSDAAEYLQRMVSNDVEALAVGEACPALLLTAKARVIAPLVILRRADDDFLVLTEPGLGEVVLAHLTRMRLRAGCEIEEEQHESRLVFGGDRGFATDWAGAREVLDEGLEPTLSTEELELRRIESGVPRWEHEID